MALLRIIQQNIDRSNTNINKMISTILSYQPHLIFFSEFNEKIHRKTIVERINSEYIIIYPKSYNEKMDKSSQICILAIKKNVGLKFIPQSRNGITTRLRYIEGILKLSDSKSINLFLTHIPQTYVPKKEKFSYSDVCYYQERVEYKAELLFAEYCFLNEHFNENLFIGGDMNTEINGNTRLETIFNEVYTKLIDSDIEKNKPTWKDKRLDYALVSNSVKKCTTARINTTSDHICLLSEIEL